ncbi:MAG TPA: carbohydrate porin, partial [Bacteroidota bacterium]|nr:carbohydrate porin [Bacteroidota bacterium]
MQSHPDFDAAYSGQNSFLTHEEAKTSVTSTIFLGARLWKGGEVYASPELSGGDGLSGATGIAGFVNGETFRIGDPRPTVTIARIFIKQTWNLSEEYSDVSDDALQLPGRLYASHIMLAVGKISMTDFFDVNRFSHDPRTQFLNWALMANGAWDYPANTRGYTWGLVAEA